MSNNDNIILRIEFTEDDSINQILINKKSTIQNLKLAIKNKLNINCDEQVLINKGEILQNDKLIKDYDIINNNRIILVKEEKEPNLIDDINDDDYDESENQIIRINQDEDNPNVLLDMNFYLKKKYGLNPNLLTSFMTSQIGKTMINNMFSDPEAFFNFVQNPIIKKVFEKEPLLKFCEHDFKNLIENQEIQMMMGQLSQVKKQKSNKIVKKNFSD